MTTMEAKIARIEARHDDLDKRIGSIEQLNIGLIKEVHTVGLGVEKVNLTLQSNNKLLEEAVKNATDKSEKEFIIIRSDIKRVADVAYKNQRQINAWQTIIKFVGGIGGVIVPIIGLVWFILGRFMEHGISFF